MADVPTGYLTWLLEQDWPRDEIRDEVKSELADRFGITATTKTIRVEVPATVPSNLREHVDSILVAGFRAAAKSAHPDKGGSNEKMRGVMAAREWLSRFVR